MVPAPAENSAIVRAEAHDGDRECRQQVADLPRDGGPSLP